ncbi:MAG: energy-coupled thiamine transporter ThiT [Coriobacteriia bacterium]|nr:energy-coupled thiamine transporter ThiT [Coriobacteriia bacterium]MCL2870167.1 energy-coupled thiamine transporter ThiT [Coriobacteriia bacterium]
MRDSRIRLIAEIGLAVALSIALNAVFTLLVPIGMPFGGSLSLNMLPIILLALMRGPFVGVITGVLVGFSDLMFDPFVISIPQMLLDYPVAYGLVGLAGLFALRPERVQQLGEGHSPTIAKLMTYAVLGVLVGSLARLGSHVLSGVIFFGQYAPEAQNIWLYSLVYNLTFMGPNMILAAILAAVTFPVVYRFVIASD